MKRLLLSALLLPLLATAQSPVVQSIPKRDECKISGMVVKMIGSEPLKNPRIQLASQDDRAESHSTVTDAGGRFDLRGIDPGRYRLVVHRDGFVTQEYGQKKSGDPGAILTLRAKQEMRDLLFRLIPSAVIIGCSVSIPGDILFERNTSQRSKSPVAVRYKGEMRGAFEGMCRCITRAAPSRREPLRSQ